MARFEELGFYTLAGAPASARALDATEAVPPFVLE